MFTEFVDQFLICGLYAKLSPTLSMMAEVPEMLLFGIEGPFIQRMFRTMLFLFCVAISYFAMDHLPVLMAVTGSVCTITAVICPVMFYFAIFRNYTSYLKRATLVVTAATAALCGVFLLFNQINSALH